MAKIGFFPKHQIVNRGLFPIVFFRGLRVSQGKHPCRSARSVEKNLAILVGHLLGIQHKGAKALLLRGEVQFVDVVQQRLHLLVGHKG